MSSLNNNNLYSTKEVRLNTLLGDIGFLAQLTRAINDYTADKQFELDLFREWLYNVYGVKVHLDPMGNLSAEHTVEDEQKFLLFTLKYAR